MRPLNYPQPGLMAKPDKACFKCKHHTEELSSLMGSSVLLNACKYNQVIYGYNPVSGSVSRKVPLCSTERGPRGNCGIDGIHWVAR